ncbi:MAG TPA: lysophospholipid acyltransferase family protein [Acidobacteriota bacterium]|nr:lysophospholipid acyltransferase family protein [Acidobacteriota bacterium]
MSASFKHKLEYSAFKGMKIFLKILPRKTLFLISRFLGNMLFALDKKHKQLAYSNLKTAFGDQYSFSKRQQVIKKTFIHFSSIFLDFIKIAGLNAKQKDRLISAQGTEILKKHLRKKKGLLIFTAHFGFWEIAVHVLSKHAKLNVIARPLDNPLLEKELSQFRASLGSHVIYKKMAAKPVLRALSQNEMVAVLIDQNVLLREGVFIQFFGKDASTTPSLATFFLRARAPIIPIFCYPTPNHDYHLKIMETPPLKITGDLDKDVRNITQICTNIIENEITKHPHLWLWFHDRWRSQP